MVYSTPLSYSSNLSYFNATWNDSFPVSSVLLESNFSGISKNYTMQNVGGNVYQFIAVLPAGTFYWKSHANDSLGNMNSSQEQAFTIAKAENSIYLYLNGGADNLTAVYGTETNVSVSAFAGTPSLYRNGIPVSNPDLLILGVGYYNYTAVISDSQNLSGAFSSVFLNVTKANPVIHLLLNEVAGDSNISYGEVSNATSYESNFGDSDVMYGLYLNGAEIGNSDVRVLAAGIYNYADYASEGENYSSSSVTRFLNVTKAVPAIRLFLNNNESNNGVVYGTETNATAEINIPAGFDLYRNGIPVSNPDVKVLAAGIYNYTAAFEGNDNYSFVYLSRILNVSKKSVCFS